MDEALSLAREAALAIGQIQLASFRRSFRVLRKDKRELVSSVDMACQTAAEEILAPFATVISEETRGDVDLTHDRCWVVDPLDGSHNYISGLPLFGCSIALVEDGEFVLGVVCLPFFDELFHAQSEGGAFLNDAPLRVSDNADLTRSLIAYDNQFHADPMSLARYHALTERAFTTRVLGSAVYDLVMIARGHIDGRVFNHTKLYDFAAGLVILREAGGRVTDMSGDEVGLTTREIVASNGKVHADLLNTLEGASR